MAAAGVISQMSDDSVTIITMDDMAAVFAVTDDFGIHRESVSVDLAREDPGAVSVDDRGAVEITLPASQTPTDFAATIRTELETRGYSLNPGQVVTNDGEDGNDEEGEDDWLG
jgi:hypothetical protein